MATPISKPAVRHKTFIYSTHVTWQQERTGLLRSRSKPALPFSSPVEFQGEEGLWTPEDFFVASVNGCLMTTFLAMAERSGLSVHSYASEAEGFLEFEDGSFRFTRITVRPRMTVSRPEDVEESMETLEKAHQRCLIANSIRSHVAVEPEISLAREVSD